MKNDMTTPSESSPVVAAELERWGFNRSGLPQRMTDGFWTPWHLASAALASAAQPEEVQVEPEDYAPPLDDEGRLMTGTDHHYTDESIRARIAQLRRFASGTKESAEEWANLDWRGFCNTTRHIMSALYAAIEPAAQPQEVADMHELAKVYAASYASPHHITFTLDGLRSFVAAARPQEVALTEADAGRAPMGWKLVPIEPTREMVNTVTANWKPHPTMPKGWGERVTKMYQQMVLAAPQAAFGKSKP